MTEPLLALLPEDLPTRPRAVAVLRSLLPGFVFTDDPDRPTWVLLVEDADGTVYAGGALTESIVRDTLAGVRTVTGDLIVGLRSDDDPLRALLPPDPPYVGRAIDLTDRVPPPDEAAELARPLPDGLRIAELTPDLLPRTEWAEDTLRVFGSAEVWAERSVGRVVLDDAGDVVAQAMAGPRVDGLLEMGVWTRKADAGRGLGTFVSRHTVVACEADGDRVWWNTNADNLASVAIARRLGFTRERAYDLAAYRTDG